MEESTTPISGWLWKRHAHTSRFGTQWSKRFVSLNSKRGTLSVGKYGSAQAKTILPLCDVNDVRLFTRVAIDHWHEHTFEIICPPLRLQLRASTEADCDRWVNTIREHVNVWHTHERLANKALSSCTPTRIATTKPGSPRQASSVNR